MTAHAAELLLVLRPDASPEVRADTARRLADVAATAGPELVNRALTVALPLPASGAVVVRCDADRCARLEVREPLAERVELRAAPDRSLAARRNPPEPRDGGSSSR